MRGKKKRKKILTGSAFLAVVFVWGRSGQGPIGHVPQGLSVYLVVGGLAIKGLHFLRHPQLWDEEMKSPDVVIGLPMTSKCLHVIDCRVRTFQDVLRSLD